jgi:hypothetical protein
VEGCDGLAFRLNRPARALTEPLTMGGEVDPPEHALGGYIAIQTQLAAAAPTAPRFEAEVAVQRWAALEQSRLEQSRLSASLWNTYFAPRTRVRVGTLLTRRTKPEKSGDAERARNGDHKGARAPARKSIDPRGACLTT